MHLLELDNPAFDNMFKAVYWAVVTLTTVGYGDAVPVSSGGQVLAAVTMTLGYTFVVLGLRHQIPLPVRSFIRSFVPSFLPLSVHNDVTFVHQDLSAMRWLEHPNDIHCYRLRVQGASGSTDDDSALESSHRSGASYVTMGDEIHLDEEGGVEMQAHSPNVARVDREHDHGDGDGDVEAEEHGSLRTSSGSMRKMISFPANDETSLSQQILPPAQGVYHHQDDDDDDDDGRGGASGGLDETKDAFDESDEGYRRTYDHSL